MKLAQLNNYIIIPAIIICLSFCGVTNSQNGNAIGISNKFQDTTKNKKYLTLNFDSLNNPIIIYCYDKIICQIFIKQDTIVYETSFTAWGELSNTRTYYLSKNNMLIPHGAHFYYREGKLSHVYNYQFGLLEGDFLVYNSKGELTERITYKSDKKIKEWSK